MSTNNNQLKGSLRMEINLYLFTASLTLFGFITAINPNLLKENFVLAIQLACAIPLFLTTVFARSKLAYTSLPKMWGEYGYITFLLAYAFITNVLGILLAISMSPGFGIFFFVFNILVNASYTILEVIEHPDKLSLRVIKDTIFALLLILGGVLPVLGIW